MLINLEFWLKNKLKHIIKTCNIHTTRSCSPNEQKELMKHSSQKVIQKVNSDIDLIRIRNEELNWLIKTNQELRVFRPQVIKTMFALREEDVKQKDEDIENVRLEHIQQKMNPNRYAAQLEKIQRTKNTKYKQ